MYYYYQFLTCKQEIRNILNIRNMEINTLQNMSYDILVDTIGICVRDIKEGNKCYSVIDNDGNITSLGKCINKKKIGESIYMDGFNAGVIHIEFQNPHPKIPVYYSYDSRYPGDRKFPIILSSYQVNLV